MMKLRVIDFETTGTDKDKKAGKPVGIVEFGFTDVDGGTGGIPSYPVSDLVNCGLPIPPEARAVHHLSDADVANGITPDLAMQTLMAGMEPGDIFVAHHAAFERAFFSGGAFPWICTLQCARHIWPDAPGHSNQTLRYWLGVDEEVSWPEMAMPPHRAGPDAYVTAHILSHMLRERHPSVLIQLSNTPVLMKNVPFGQSAGQPWSSMDVGFLRWCLEPGRYFREDQREAILHTARHWLNQANLSGTPFA